MNNLVQKYLNGETSLQEEQELRDYVLSDQVATEHLELRDMFSFFEQAASPQVDSYITMKLEQQTRQPWYKRYNVPAAASVVLGIGLATGMYFSNQADYGTYNAQESEEAYEQTIMAFQMLGTKMNKGVNKTRHVKTIEKKTEIFKND